MAITAIATGESDDRVGRIAPAPTSKVANEPTRILEADTVSAELDHLYLTTQLDSKQIRINSRNFTQASGTAEGFQTKPAQSANGESVTGCEVSPRVLSGITLSGNIIGIHADAYLKGTATGTITGDVRAANLELVTDDAGTRTVSGNVNFIRMRAAFSATTISGKFCPIRIEKAETQTNSKQYDGLLDLPSTNGTGTSTVWTDAGVSSATNAGCLGIWVNGNKRYINLFSGTPA